MTNDIDLNDAFSQTLLSKVVTAPRPWPRVFPNPDGDCIEVLLSDDNYRAERLDSLVTVYVNRENGELVGAIVKGISRYVQKMVEQIPGFMIEIVDRKVKLEYLFTASLWSHGKSANQVLVQRYQRLRKIAEQADIEVELEAV